MMMIKDTMGDVQESTTIRRTQRNPCKPSWLTTNMIVAYALQSLRRRSRLHTEKLKSVQSQDVEGCHNERDEFSIQKRYLRIVRVAQGKEGDRL